MAYGDFDTFGAEDLLHLTKMLEYVASGTGVLVAGAVHADIPTIHDVGNREGQRLHTTGEVQHCGFGMFTAKTAKGNVNFDGGGAMYHAPNFGWCLFTGPIAETGYDILSVKTALEDLINRLTTRLVNAGQWPVTSD